MNIYLVTHCSNPYIPYFLRFLINYPLELKDSLLFTDENYVLCFSVPFSSYLPLKSKTIFYQICSTQKISNVFAKPKMRVQLVEANHLDFAKSLSAKL